MTQSNLDKYTITPPDLKNNQGLIIINGHAAQQNHHAPYAFAELLSVVRPKRILEIGTALGGFTWFLKTVADDNFIPIEILTYDIYRREWFDDLQQQGIADFRTQSIWKNDHNARDGIIEDAISFVRQDGVSIVLCDGGAKIEEFKEIAPHLKVGDIIMAHDYASSKDVFEQTVRGILWNWCEITDDDIRDTCSKNGLVPFMDEQFSKAVWVCRRKMS